MPRIPNKILIDQLDFDGDSAAMKKAFRAGAMLADEVVEIGGGIVGNQLLAEDAKLHLPEQESICADLRTAMASAIKRQRELNDTRRKWLDGEIDKLSQP